MVLATSAEGKSLLSKLKDLSVGKRIQFSGFIPGLNNQVDAHCTEIVEGKFWQFSLYWCSVHIQDVVVEVNEEKIIIEALGV